MIRREPWIAVAEKLGYKLIVEAHYVGTEIAGPELSDETFAKVRALKGFLHQMQIRQRRLRPLRLSATGACAPSRRWTAASL